MSCTKFGDKEPGSNPREDRALEDSFAHRCPGLGPGSPSEPGAVWPFSTQTTFGRRKSRPWGLSMGVQEGLGHKGQIHGEAGAEAGAPVR